MTHAISPTREVDFPQWYQEIIKAADLAENSPVRGCMVIKPFGFAIWEKMQRILDDQIKATGCKNAYFPLFIPLSFLEKEASHVEGFAKECAVVTHHRLEEKDGKLIPCGQLEEPLIVRPTSETIIGESFSRWVESYRDLPLLINQWANVVRWEMRPRLFLRTTEFLWQEGHTVHATEEEARSLTMSNLELYRHFAEETMAIPVILGEKCESERFPGAVQTLTIEAMMQDRKALQAGTSHYLGQNFSKTSNIRFTRKDGVLDFGYTTSFGLSTRMIGALIMTHGDDDGLRLPPKISPIHVVILPFGSDDATLAYADRIASILSMQRYAGHLLTVHVDKRDMRGGEKNWEWIKKGIPIRLEVGPREREKEEVSLCRRDRPHKEKKTFSLTNLDLPALLEEIQSSLFLMAKTFRDEYLRTDLKNLNEFKDFFLSDKGGFVLAPWCEEPSSEALLEDLKVTIRCLPLDQDGKEGRCILTGRPAAKKAVFAKSY